MDEATKTPAGPDDFFADINTDEDLKSFIAHMEQPREEIPQLPDFDEGGAIGPIEGEEGEPGEELSREEKDMVQYFDFTDEHRLTAEIGLVWIDRLMAMIASFITGRSADAYRTRKGSPCGICGASIPQGKPPKDDYEIQLAAALVKKYQMRLSLEWAFLMAMGMRYGPVMASVPREVRKAKVEAEVKVKAEKGKE